MAPAVPVVVWLLAPTSVEGSRTRCVLAPLGPSLASVRGGWRCWENGEVVEPFVSVVSDADLEELRGRLRATRWPERETDERQGVALTDLQELCSYWAQDYDWRRCEERLASIGWFRASVDGLNIAFLHARSGRADAFPLVLTHGWPGSVIEFVDAWGPLTAAGFTCVVPSLPGYGWSDKPSQPGGGGERIARGWAELMAQLGYQRYGAVGSDWGTSVSASLGQQDPAHVAGVHLVPPLAPPLPGTVRSDGKPRGGRVLDAATDSAADDRVFAGRLTSGPGCVDH